ncbi:MAG: ATP-dependent RNA helicase DbpA [Bacteriovoracaceae bacterium]|nr:ATP-dependent RNA helicase DbpA [Bacteriovoracaceae bacterium]
MIDKFEQYPLKKELLRNLEELKFHTMTPIQARSLPAVLEGIDIIAKAKTGSGKTAAFGLGVLNTLDSSSSSIQSLILCPTRELAEQVAKEIRSLARMMKNVKVLTICGGSSEFYQEKSLSYGAHIIVGTPGRILRLLKKETLDFSGLNSFILDEADRMLDMGFNDDIMRIESHLPTDRQTMLFSATFPEGISELSETIQKNAIEVSVDVEHSVDSIDQMFYELERHQDKNDCLLKILATFQPERSLVFCKTKQITADLADFLVKSGIKAAGIHGDLMQNERTSVLTKFSNQSLSVLVATDVAARGLDIQDLPAVINFDLPSDPEVYVHRIGRTGRAGKTGLALSLYITKNQFRVEAIEEFTGNEFTISELNTLSDTDSYNLLPPMQTMYVSGGKKNKLRPGDIVGALVGEAGLSSDDIGDISILPMVSFVAVKRDQIDHAVDSLRAGKIKNRKFKIGFV